MSQGVNQIETRNVYCDDALGATGAVVRDCRSQFESVDSASHYKKTLE